MRILFVAPRQSWPPVSGAKLREYHMARTLGKQGELTYLYFNEPGLELSDPKDFPFCKELIGVPWPDIYSWGRLLRGLVGRWPLPVVNYTTDAMAQALHQAIANGPFDVVHMDGIHLAAYQTQLQKELPGARIFYNWHNVESELM